MAGKQSKPGFLWQGLLLLAPVVIFACIGMMLLRRDRMSVKQEALENARVLAGQIAEDIGPRLSGFIEESYIESAKDKDWDLPPQMASAWEVSDGTNSFDVNVPMPQYRAFLETATNFGVAGLSLASTFPRLILNTDGQLVWPKPYASPPAMPALGTVMTGAESKWRQAQGSVSAENKEEALALLTSLATNREVTLSESGIPIQPLASFQKLHLLDTKDSGAFQAGAFALASNAVVWPSTLSPRFLDEAVRAWPEKKIAWRSAPLTWRQSWWLEEESRAMFAHLAENGALPALAQPHTAVWTEWRNRWWLVIHSDEVTRDGEHGDNFVGLRFYPQSLVEMALLQLLDQSRLRTPPYAGVSFEVAGRPLPQETNSIILAEYPMPVERRGGLHLAEKGIRKPEVAIPLGSNSTVLAESPMTWKNNGGINIDKDMKEGFHVTPGDLPGLSVRVHLSRPNELFLLQRQRERWFGGLILLSLLVSLIGCFAAYRAFRRQIVLSDMKSNFVSSVSHELRAPIASVRLMAESLERGKVVEGEKQNEYYRFIVQECRRLSSLIENVLDFSRIEQGRKQYEFEPTDLLALTRETVKLMEPYAEEKGVKLETLKLEHRTPNVEVEIDGRAIQQALVNLMDNAIKHSAKGQVVTIGLDAGTGAGTIQNANSGNGGMPVLLYVEDHGPGIPAGEHEKIFERFYRLGSELRRETQGVGIGLSIVRHIVEAHGGTVTVRSNVGKGSRFTIVLPVLNAKAQSSEGTKNL